MMEDTKKICQDEALRLTCDAAYPGDVVEVIEWRNQGKTKGRQKKTERRKEAMDKIRDFKKAYHECGHNIIDEHKRGTSKNIGAHARASASTERYHQAIEEQHHWPVFLEMKDIEVGHVLVTRCVLAWPESWWNEKNEDGMRRVWTFTMAWKRDLQSVLRRGELCHATAGSFGNEVTNM